MTDKERMSAFLKGDMSSLSSDELNDVYNFFSENYANKNLGDLANVMGLGDDYISGSITDTDSFWDVLAKKYNFADSSLAKNKEQSAETLQRIQDIANQSETGKTATTNAQNAGINRTKAGLLGSAGANSAATNDTVSGVQSNLSNATSTQNDWLAQQGYITGLENQANNYRKGMALNAGSAFLGGFGSGLQLGGHI